MKKLLLGSSSPRRKEILSYFTYPFTQVSPHFDEKLIPFNGDPASYVTELSTKKAASLASHYSDTVILTADTCVYKNGKLYNKPEDDDEALQMLTELSGSPHTVYTGVTVQLGEKTYTDHAETKILFHDLPREELALYHNAFRSTDKAGGYGIQQAGSVIVKQIDGCFYNVMGLPISLTCTLLKGVGIDLWYYLA
ncbi:MAG: Septum formation protein Maf [Chlamydiae bacterium]|nr:Septum formation protein Maf [Chlamydiota bacterium]